METEENIEESAPEQNSAAVFAECLLNQVNSNDVWSMKVLQREMLSRFEKTNEMLINFNMLSSSRYNVTAEDFRKHTLMLYDMKKDLDLVFKRIRVLKQRLSKTYPEAFAVCSDICSMSERLDDGEQETETATSSDQPSTSTTITSITPDKDGETQS
ncbi:hypothetical protein LOTGIDRAFT_234693 [Lottia gigantea]|uniref:KxDL domain-containing protein n=1 Tax=Lottia gigantea TaxID=225164 RepID=V3ZAV5_LOTGI|nr:hypothetical protein LOTGIDRAFT_234693 [Lottia gigantea]ESO88123.1 hypothetical protein LOTGIDRAFT_234693 [Lottia gigantea]